MKFKKQIFVESAVGLFTFAVMGALFMLTVVLSRDAIFRSALPMEVVFDNVMGLRVGDAVSARGVTVGKVKQIALREDGVHVHALLDTPVHLRADYRIEVLPTSVLGGRYLNVHEGSYDEPAVETAMVLKGSPSADLIDSATRTVEDIREALNDGVLEDLKATMAQVRKIATRLGDGEGLLGKLLVDGTLYGEIEQIAGNLRQISDAVAKGEGTLGKLVADDGLYDDAQAVAANLRQATDAIAKGEGTLGRLLAPGDPMAEDLAATLASFRTISETVAKGEGTLGKLVTDEELYEEFKSLVTEGRAAVDDIRETSPITTFTSIFFGVF